MNAIDAYREPCGLISNQKNPAPDSSGNLLSITSIWYWMQGYCPEYENLVRLCWQTKPGLLYRSPTKKDQDSVDDYVCVLAASRGEYLARQIYLRAVINMNVMNNEKPGAFSFKAWMGRYPFWKALLKYSVGNKPSFFEKALFSLSIDVFRPKNSSDSSAHVLNFMMKSARSGDRARDPAMKVHLARWLSVDGLPNFEHPIVACW